MAPITTIIDIARPELEVFDYVIDPIRFIGRATRPAECRCGLRWDRHTLGAPQVTDVRDPDGRAFRLETFSAR
jgi:hypothetical protein